MDIVTCTVESCDYAPPPFCMLALGKIGGGGLIPGIVAFYLTNATWTRDLCTFSGYLMDKTREKTN
jgi:hypothetical protein